MDGFPQSEAQISLLKELRIKPSLVCIFEQPEEVSIARVTNRRTDPETGTDYRLSSKNAPTEEAITERLIQKSDDTAESVKARIVTWNEAVPRVEEAFKKVVLSVQSDQPSEAITEEISEAI